ncbi:MAG: hypothetical protein FJZ56_05185 [Chlamydiae bacterium]|nr:hypothetical protein [Chlamydiota bacterium]
MSISAVCGFQQNFSNNDIESLEPAVSKVYNNDCIKNIIRNKEPSEADIMAFKDKEIAFKTYVELNSGRLVEVLHFTDDSKECVGSFSDQAHESCQEGFASYDHATDKLWCDLVSLLEEQHVEESDNWSCAWNSYQNMIYLQTGIKVSVKELISYYIDRLLDETLELFDKLDSVESKEELDELLEARILNHTIMISSIFTSESGPYLGASMPCVEKLFFSSLGVCSQEDVSHQTPYMQASELSEGIENHNFRVNGPLTLGTSSEAFLLLKNEEGRVCVIDPHNMKRRADFKAKSVIESSLASQSEKDFTLIARDLSQKTHHYRRCDYVGGLDQPFICSKVVSAISSSRLEKPLDAEELFGKMTHLIDQMNAFDYKFSEKTFLLS